MLMWNITTLQDSIKEVGEAFERLGLCLVPGKLKEKENKKENEKERKKKIDLKSINYFYMLIQTYFTSFFSSI